MKQPIVQTPSGILTTLSKTVSVFDKRLLKLIADMKATLLSTKSPRGVGLAAIQIGQPYRIFITKPTDDSPMRVFINPEIIEKSEELTDGVPERKNKLEGCLSVPTIWGNVRRSQSVTLAYQDETGQAKKESFSGFLATIIQHEADHTNGILFSQRVLEQSGKLFQETKNKEGKPTLEELKL